MATDDHDLSDLERSVHDQLTAWGMIDAPEGQAALDIADRLANTEDLRPAAAAMLHAQLRALLADLRKLAPPAEVDDAVSGMRDEVGKLRAVPDL